MNPWLVALIILLSFAAGLTVRDVVVALTGGRYGGTIDLSRPAARGELDLDWDDARPRGEEVSVNGLMARYVLEPPPGLLDANFTAPRGGIGFSGIQAAQGPVRPEDFFPPGAFR